MAWNETASPQSTTVMVSFSEADQDWLEDANGLGPSVDAKGDGLEICRMDLGPLRCALEQAFPQAQTIKDYADAIAAISGNTPLSGSSFVAGCNDMSDAETAAFALKVSQAIIANDPACRAMAAGLISEDPDNSLRLGDDGKIKENDATV